MENLQAFQKRKMKEIEHIFKKAKCVLNSVYKKNYEHIDVG